MTIDWPTQILAIEIIVSFALVFGMGFYLGRKFELAKRTTVPKTGQLKEKQQLEQPFVKRKGFRPKTEEENKLEKKTYTIN